MPRRSDSQQELAASFFGARLWVRIALDAEPASATDVRYYFGEDAALAGDIAAFLPVLTSTDAAFTPNLDAAPGEIVVRLVGGPAKEEPASVASRLSLAPRELSREGQPLPRGQIHAADPGDG